MCQVIIQRSLFLYHFISLSLYWETHKNWNGKNSQPLSKNEKVGGKILNSEVDVRLL